MGFFSIGMDEFVSSTPRPIAQLLDSLDPVVQGAEGTVGKVVQFMDFSGQKTPPHTETSYVPDLTQGELQPLEDMDDDWLQKVDLEAIVAQAAKVS